MHMQGKFPEDEQSILFRTLSVHHQFSSEPHTHRRDSSLYMVLPQTLPSSRSICTLTIYIAGFFSFAFHVGFCVDPRRNLKLNGIPVLFIPGNAGSYKQGNKSAIQDVSRFGCDFE